MFLMLIAMACSAMAVLTSSYMLHHGEHEDHAAKAAKVAHIIAAPALLAAATQLKNDVAPLFLGATVIQQSRAVARSFFEQRRWDPRSQKVPAVKQEVATHIAEAQDATGEPMPPFDLDRAPADLRAAVRFSASYLGRPDELAKERQRRFECLERCSERCAAQWDQLKELRPEHIAQMRDPVPNTPLFACCSQAVCWPDCVAADFTLGFQQVGSIPPCGALKSKPCYNPNGLGALCPLGTLLTPFPKYKRSAEARSVCVSSQ